MEPNTDPAMQTELLRRRASLGASSAGIGAGQTNSMSPTNPIAQSDQMTNPTGGAAGFPTAGAQQQLKQEKSESMLILETMKARLKALGDMGK